jgi:hypothetical protein
LKPFDAGFRAAIIAIMAQPRTQPTEDMNRPRPDAQTNSCGVCGDTFPSFAALIAHERREDHGPLRAQARP